MTAYSKAIKLGLTGTDAEIVAVLQTLTARNITSRDASIWMRENGLWIEGPNNDIEGTLYELYCETQDPAIKSGLREWYASTIKPQAENILGTDPVWAGKIARVSTLIASVIQDGENLIADLYSLFGGRPYATLTVEQFAAERAAAETPVVDPEWTDTTVLLSANLSPQSQSVMLRLSRCAIVDGRVVAGPVIATLATSKAADDPRLVGLLAEAQKLVETISNG